MYRTGEVVLGRGCLQYVKNVKDKKRSELMLVIEGHKKATKRSSQISSKSWTNKTRNVRQYLPIGGQWRLVVYVQLIRNT